MYLNRLMNFYTFFPFSNSIEETACIPRVYFNVVNIFTDSSRTFKYKTGFFFFFFNCECVVVWNAVTTGNGLIPVP